ncbi:hypothetical protein [Nocardioides nematodiphilus]|uniref:hypothetical protein n=1 Tax=Nocardioides nematodiphilus TaxID=2849669 RepID=UPI001CD976F1|nr:hypothetical protein [Nocardioides nematodiphilus]MCA1982272.1 hypothetical protein [Nocardioides nematodiphilus]
MTQAQSNGYSDEQLEAIQAVVDRVTSWQDGATEGTVVEELRRGLDEVGVQVGDSDVARLADAIEARHGAISAAQILGG